MIKEHSENTDLTNFKIPLANINDINQILEDINIKKSPGPDLLLPDLVKEVANLINEPRKNIIN